VRGFEDVQITLTRGLVLPEAIRSSFAAIEPRLYRYPAIDPVSFRIAVEETLGSRTE
jgi:hypothetical protein